MEGSIFDLPLDQLELPIRTYNCLKNEGVSTLREATLKTDAELLRVPNFGRQSLIELRAFIRGAKEREPFPLVRPDAANGNELVHEAFVAGFTMAQTCTWPVEEAWQHSKIRARLDQG